VYKLIHGDSDASDIPRPFEGRFLRGPREDARRHLSSRSANAAHSAGIDWDGECLKERRPRLPQDHDAFTRKPARRTL
jgi:hypothetical protein